MNKRQCASLGQKIGLGKWPKGLLGKALCSYTETFVQHGHQESFENQEGKSHRRAALEPSGNKEGREPDQRA